MTELQDNLPEQNPLAQDSYETKAAALSTIDGLTIEDCVRYFAETPPVAAAPEAVEPPPGEAVPVSEQPAPPTA